MQKGLVWVRLVAFVVSTRLYQIPQVTIQVFEHSNGAVWFFYSGAHNFNTLLLQVVVIAPKVVGMQKQKYAATGLVAYTGGLFFVSRAVGWWNGLLHGSVDLDD